MRKFVLLFTFILFNIILYSQNTVEITLGSGYTVVDIEKLVTVDEVQGSFATDWGNINGALSVNYLFGSEKLVNYGVEVMYQHLYWYSVSVPYGSQTIYREYSVSAGKLIPFLRIGKGPITFDFGGEIIFSGGLKGGVLTSLNYLFPINDKISVPLKFRTELVTGTVLSFPISINGGVEIKL